MHFTVKTRDILEKYLFPKSLFLPSLSKNHSNVIFVVGCDIFFSDYMIWLFQRKFLLTVQNYSLSDGIK